MATAGCTAAASVLRPWLPAVCSSRQPFLPARNRARPSPVLQACMTAGIDGSCPFSFMARVQRGAARDQEHSSRTSCRHRLSAAAPHLLLVLLRKTLPARSTFHAQPWPWRCSRRIRKPASRFPLGLQSACWGMSNHLRSFEATLVMHLRARLQHVPVFSTCQAKQHWLPVQVGLGAALNGSAAGVTPVL